MEFNASKLRGRIIERFGTQGEFAAAMKFTKTSLSNKMNGRTDWTLSEIRRACDLLNIDRRNVADYFFVTETKEV